MSKEENQVVEEKTPTQHRVERAERQTEERILNELGVKSVDEIKELLERGKQSEELLDETHKELELASRKDRLKRELSNNEAFDPDVLIPFVDVNTLENDEDFEDAIEQLKNLKPNHFGVKSIKSDQHKESSEVKTNPVDSKYLQGDYVGSIAESIRLRKKGR